ncbi:MAG: fibrobacter succinogenes major paralogous domain-containing protein [Bacteroidetes bacterium]|nr:fibrobacter succinogenes major paralogous domain-containing protein [Bacteroidota bacterium]
MKKIIRSIVLILLCATSMVNAQTDIIVKDIFGRILNDYQVTLVDWQGALANPYITLNLESPKNIPPGDYPVEVKIEASSSPRLMLNNPSINNASGATKTIKFRSASDIQSVKLTIAPDRDGKVNGKYSIESYTLSFSYLNKKQTLPIKVIDQDDDLKATFPFEVDFSPDSKDHPENKYLVDRNKSLFADEVKDKANRDAVRQAINDWFYFFQDPGYDEVAINEESVELPGFPTWGENKLNVKNKKAYKGFYLFVRTNYDGIHSGSNYGNLWSTGYPIESKNQTIKGQPIAADIPRSGVMIIENADQLPVYNQLDNNDWNNAEHGKFNDLYGLTMHEFGHTIVFESRLNNTKKYKESTSKESLAPNIYNYQGMAPVIDNSYHLEAPGNVDRLSGQTGGWNGDFPQRRWLLTKLALLFAEQAGWKLRTDVQPFMEHTITSNSTLPKLAEGTPYEFQLEATGGVPFYHWELISGELPEGLSLNKFTGKISGTHLIKNGKSNYQFTIGLKDYDEKSDFFKKQFSITIESAETVTDIDGNRYKTVKIGDQTWMAENLRTTKCNDGTPISRIQIGESSTGAGMYWHSNNPSSENSKKYGPLYNWPAVTKCDVCPSGWRVPTQDEWNKVLRFWYGKKDDQGNTIYSDQPYKGAGLAYAAKQLRETGSIWPNNESATNSTGFSAVPGGWLWGSNFSYLGRRTAYWSTKNGSPMFTKVADGNNGTWTGQASSQDVLYIRCIKKN